MNIDSPDLSDIARILNAACPSLSIDYFIIGRIARDYWLKDFYFVERLGKTEDLDFALMVRDWESYRKLRNRLLTRPEKDFSDTSSEKSVIYRDRLRVDLVPAGGVADRDAHVRWPPLASPEMNVQGFEDVAADSRWIIFGNERAKMASPQGLAFLKIIAWNDQPVQRSKDIADLGFLLEFYEKITETDRLYEGFDADLINEEDFDLPLAWARILGRDIGRMIIHPATALCLQSIFKREQSEPFSLVSLFQKFVPCDFEFALKLLNNLALGMDEGLKKISG